MQGVALFNQPQCLDHFIPALGLFIGAQRSAHRDDMARTACLQPLKNLNRVGRTTVVNREFGLRHLQRTRRALIRADLGEPLISSLALIHAMGGAGGNQCRRCCSVATGLCVASEPFGASHASLEIGEQGIAQGGACLILLTTGPVITNTLRQTQGTSGCDQNQMQHDETGSQQGEGKVDRDIDAIGWPHDGHIAHRHSKCQQKPDQPAHGAATCFRRLRVLRARRRWFRPVRASRASGVLPAIA